MGLDILEHRHHKYFTAKYESLKKIDEFFLTMEGLGQFTMYAWLTHKNGANLSAETAIAGVRRGKNHLEPGRRIRLVFATGAVLRTRQLGKATIWRKNGKCN